MRFQNAENRQRRWRVRHNRSVDSDTLRQGAARRRWESCTLRPLAATCRSPLRWHRMRSFLTVAALAPMAAFACSPPPDMKPLTVEELFQNSAYVAYVEVKSVKESGGIELAEVKILEQFKGNPISTVASPADSCGLSLYAGEKRILFLTKERKGHALAYPWNLTLDSIFAKLRGLKR